MSEKRDEFLDYLNNKIRLYEDERRILLTEIRHRYVEIKLKERRE